MRFPAFQPNDFHLDRENGKMDNVNANLTKRFTYRITKLICNSVVILAHAEISQRRGDRVPAGRRGKSCAAGTVGQGDGDHPRMSVRSRPDVQFGVGNSRSHCCRT